MQKLLTALMLLAATCLAFTAQAQVWNHNGSIMSVSITNDQIKIYYAQPRKVMLDAGAKPNDLLFEGTINGNIVVGVAKIFANTCGQFTYQVAGSINANKSEINLNGQAPVVDRSTCKQIRLVPDALAFNILPNNANTDTSANHSGQSQTPPNHIAKNENYGDRIRACVQPNVSFPTPPRKDSQNPTAQYRVKLNPNGTINTVDLTKSSGNISFDAAVRKGIFACQQFPKPAQRDYPTYIDIAYNMYDISDRNRVAEVDGETQAIKEKRAIEEAAKKRAVEKSIPKSKFPSCQGSNVAIWNMCFGEFTNSNGKYAGEFKDGKSAGKGTFTFSDGRQYVGEFKEGNSNGHGTLTYTDGKTYVGEFRDGRFSGDGTYTFPNGAKHIGQFNNGTPNGKGTSTLADGRQYIGEFKDGQFHGQGKFTFPDGKTYTGEFKDGNPNGKGSLTFSDGRQYVGEFKDGKRSGQGTFTSPDGIKYVGQVNNDLPNGMGTYTTPDGGKYVGQFKNGIFSGHGTFTFPFGGNYIGEFKDDKPNGKGTVTYESGEKYNGDFKDGKPDGYGTLTHKSGIILQTGRWADAIFVGRPTPPSVVSKIDQITLAQKAERGDADAQYEYGMTFINGSDNEIKPRIAIEWLMKAQTQGHENAKKQIASMFDLGVQMSIMPSSIKVYE